MLINLPNDSWIDPKKIIAIRTFKASGDTKDRVIIFNDGYEIIYFDSFDEAKEFASNLAALSNEN